MIHYRNINECGSFRALADLPKVDVAAALTPERIAKYTIKMPEAFTYGYAASPVNEAIIDALQRLADEQQLIDKLQGARRGRDDEYRRKAHGAAPSRQGTAGWRRHFGRAEFARVLRRRAPKGSRFRRGGPLGQDQGFDREAIHRGGPNRHWRLRPGTARLIHRSRTLGEGGEAAANEGMVHFERRPGRCRQRDARYRPRNHPFHPCIKERHYPGNPRQ